MKIGDNIKRIRKEKGMKQKELAQKLNMPVSTLANYENNKREPNLDTIREIALALNTFDVFLIGDSKQLNKDFMLGANHDDMKALLNYDDKCIVNIGECITLITGQLLENFDVWCEGNDLYKKAVLNFFENLSKLSDQTREFDINALINALNDTAEFMKYQSYKVFKKEGE